MALVAQNQIKLLNLAGVYINIPNQSFQMSNLNLKIHCTKLTENVFSRNLHLTKCQVSNFQSQMS